MQNDDSCNLIWFLYVTLHIVIREAGVQTLLLRILSASPWDKLRLFASSLACVKFNSTGATLNLNGSSTEF